jgi:hypothetical protein
VLEYELLSTIFRYGGGGGWSKTFRNAKVSDLYSSPVTIRSEVPKWLWQDKYSSRRGKKEKAVEWQQ